VRSSAHQRKRSKRGREAEDLVEESLAMPRNIAGGKLWRRHVGMRAGRYVAQQGPDFSGILTSRVASLAVLCEAAGKQRQVVVRLLPVVVDLQHRMAPAWRLAVGTAALAMACVRRSGGVVVHQLTHDATELVHATDLRTWPSKPPALMDGGWVIESKRGVLFGQVCSIGGHDAGLGDGTSVVHGRMLSGEAWVCPITVPWGHRGDAEAAEQMDCRLLPPELETQLTTLAAEALLFAVTLGLLLEAEHSPDAVKERGDTKDRSRRHRGAQPGQPRAWSERVVYLTEAPSPTPRHDDTGSRETVEMGGRVEARAQVRGHLRSQPSGPGGRQSQRRLQRCPRGSEASPRWS